jgi:ATP-dependent DNA helicase RecQ
LIIFKHLREIALGNNTKYVIPDGGNLAMGIPVHPEIKKLNIGWAAGNFIFNSGVNDYIKNQIKSGDFVNVRRRTVPNNGHPFTVHELFKDGSDIAIGKLSRDAGHILLHSACMGFVVNEVVIWSYEDTVKFDRENPGRNYAAGWCEQAKVQGYIYLVDFAGFGIPQ